MYRKFVSAVLKHRSAGDAEVFFSPLKFIGFARSLRRVWRFIYANAGSLDFFRSFRSFSFCAVSIRNFFTFS